MTKEEAEKKLQEYKNESLGLCPVICESCKTECVCYCKARIYVTYKDNWHFVEACCSSPLITGYVECNPA